MALEVENMKEEDVAGIEDIPSDDDGNKQFDMTTEIAKQSVQDDYVALNPENLKLHAQKWHSSESTESPPEKVNNKKVKCDICFKVASSSHHLKMHKQAQHENVLYLPL